MDPKGLSLIEDISWININVGSDIFIYYKHFCVRS